MCIVCVCVCLKVTQLDCVFGAVSNETSQNEHLDSSSYSWCLMRYAIVKYVRHSFVTFLPQIGIELSGSLRFFILIWHFTLFSVVFVVAVVVESTETV